MLHEYQSRFGIDRWTVDPRQIMFTTDGGSLIINKALVDRINDSSVQHEIWLSDECLALYFNQWTHSVSGAWVSVVGPHDGKRVTWSWVERLYKPEENLRAISLEIEDYRKFVWVFHLHDDEENYDKRLNIRKGRWPD